MSYTNGPFLSSAAEWVAEGKEEIYKGHLAVAAARNSQPPHLIYHWDGLRLQSQALCFSSEVRNMVATCKDGIVLISALESAEIGNIVLPAFTNLSSPAFEPTFARPSCVRLP